MQPQGYPSSRIQIICELLISRLVWMKITLLRALVPPRTTSATISYWWQDRLVELHFVQCDLACELVPNFVMSTKVSAV